MPNGKPRCPSASGRRSTTILVLLALVAPARAAALGEGYFLEWAERPKGTYFGPAVFIRQLSCNDAGACSLVTTKLICRGEELYASSDVRETGPRGSLEVRRGGDWVTVKWSDPVASQTHKLKVQKFSDAQQGRPQDNIFVTGASGAMVMGGGDKIQTVELEAVSMANPSAIVPPIMTTVLLPCNKVVVKALEKK